MRRPFRRVPAHRPQLDRVVIACEGRSERAYFEGIRMAVRPPRAIITLAHVAHTDPLGIVEAAVRRRAQFRYEDTWNLEDTAWAVLDGDEHVQRDAANWRDAEALAAREHIALVVCNPCIELWYLLHFQGHHSHLSSRQAVERLRKHLPDYEKAQRLYPNPLAARTDDALLRAQELSAFADREGLGPLANPGAGIWRLVERLTPRD